MEEKEKYWPKNQLQKDCLRFFRKWFPEFASKIQFVEPLMHPDNFCFTIESDSPEFGNLTFDIDHQEITVITKFDHHHYETHLYDHEKDESVRRQKTIWTALNSVKDLINGNEIIELEKRGDKMIRAFRFHKNNPAYKYSAVVYLEAENEEAGVIKNKPVEKILVSWNGIISREIMDSASQKVSNSMGSDLNKNNTREKISLWAKLKRLWL